MKESEVEHQPLAKEVEVQVAVSNITGDEVTTFQVTSKVTGLGLRRAVAERMSAPVDSARLLLDGEAVVDDAWVVPESRGHETLKFVLIKIIVPRHIQPFPLLSDNYWSTAATAWDDGDFLRKLFADRPDAALASVTLTQNEGCVKGIRCIYRTSDGEVEAPRHDESWRGGYYVYHWPEVPPVTLVLEEGERINLVKARVGEILDGLELFTDRGQRVAAGGQGGNLHQVDIEEGSCVVGFSGHENCVLVRLGFYLL